LEVGFRKKDGPNWSRYRPRSIKTDREGRFRIEALVPDYEFRLSDGKDKPQLVGELRLGETKDLGDVQMKVENE
jgi:hypothetical protein